MNFELILCLLTLVSGIFWVLIAVIKRVTQGSRFFQPKLWPRYIREPFEFLASLFPVFLMVFLFRSFLYEPFVIPSGSLEPTLEIGDFVLVNKFDYGLRKPISHEVMLPISDPKRGEIMVFLNPRNPRIYFIKRVIGLPGDRISYVNKILYINGKEMPQIVLGSRDRTAQNRRYGFIEERQENLDGVVHNILVRPNASEQDYYDIQIPPKHYFVMGDNRDDSDDSRYWGTVPDHHIVGRARYIWFSWDTQTSNWLKKIRFNRMFKSIQQSSKEPL